MVFGSESSGGRVSFTWNQLGKYRQNELSNIFQCCIFARKPVGLVLRTTRCLNVSICCGEVLVPHGGPWRAAVAKARYWTWNCVMHMFVQVVFRKDIGCNVSVADGAFFLGLPVSCCHCCVIWQSKLLAAKARLNTARGSLPAQNLQCHPCPLVGLSWDFHGCALGQSAPKLWRLGLGIPMWKAIGSPGTWEQCRIAYWPQKAAGQMGPALYI
jgi:hypothetical protein